MAMGLSELLEAEKAIRPLPGWRPVDAGGMLRWQAPLSINGAVLEGANLHGRARANEPGRDVSFTLETRPAGGRSIRIDRIDWNPIEPHGNNGAGRAEIRFDVIGGNHRHEYYENLKMGGDLRSGNLPVAVPIHDPLPNFGALIAFVALTYKINGLEHLQPPPWSEDLFG